MEGREEGIPVCEVIRQEEQDSRPLGLLRKGDNSFISLMRTFSPGMWGSCKPGQNNWRELCT